MKLTKVLKASLLTSAVLLASGMNVMADNHMYTVKPGDTLYKIAVANGVTLDDMLAVNKIDNVDLIFVGAKLNIPESEKMMAYKKALADAKAALDKAASVGGEWRDSRWKKSKFVKYKAPNGKTIKSSFVGAAKAAASHGDYDRAIEYLATAKKQGELGYAQAMQQKDAAPRL